MASPVYANPADLANLQTILHRHIFQPSSSQDALLSSEVTPRLIGTIVTQFLLDPIEKNWLRMHYAIQNFLVAGEGGSVQLLAGLRVLVCLADGHVAYDSKKSNSWSNFQTKTINENHNSRLSIMSALLGNSGNAFELRHSMSDGYKEAYNAQRIGPSAQNALGCVRVSVKAAN